MLAQWTGEVVGQMHQRQISMKDLAAAIGWNPKYLSQVLNGRVNPRGAEEKVRRALASLVPQEPKKTNPAIALVAERKELLVGCAGDLEKVAGELNSGEWIGLGCEQVGGGRYLFTLGRVC